MLLLGVTGAFVFAARMLNFPVAGGTRGHFPGAALATVLLGPWLAWPPLACCALLLAVVAAAARLPARVIARRALVVLPLVAIAAASLPFLHDGGAEHRLVTRRPRPR